MKIPNSVLALSIASFLLVAGSVNAEAERANQSPAVASKQVCQKMKSDGASAEQLAKRGCCSWHGGVCGCVGGRVTCCDQTFSPSCTCHKEDAPGVKS